jgi:hypothetical protein
VFLKTHRIFKDGKHHIYYSLCESLRVSRKGVLQRRVLNLGELNTTQLERWQRTIEVVEEDGGRHQMRLFTDRQSEPAAAGAPEDGVFCLSPQKGIVGVRAEATPPGNAEAETHSGLRPVGNWFSAVLRGHYAYYGLTGNHP